MWLSVPVSEGGGNYSITTSRLGIIESLIGEFSSARLSPALSLDKRLAGFQLAAPTAQRRTHRSRTARQRPGERGQVEAAEASLRGAGWGGEVRLQLSVCSGKSNAM